MVRTLLAAATVATFALTFAPSAALACGGDSADGDCPCAHAAKKAEASAANDVKKDAVTPAKANEKKAVEPAKKDVKPVQQTSIMDEVDRMLAAKCDCHSQADCTCKKGECKCGKCGGHKKTNTRMIESVRDTNDSTEIPANARYDATAGVFI